MGNSPAPLPKLHTGAPLPTDSLTDQQPDAAVVVPEPANQPMTIATAATLLVSPAETPPAALREEPKQPALSVVPPAAPPREAARASADGGEAQLREALSKASREVIERIAWEVVPELAETIIREELDRLMKERGA